MVLDGRRGTNAVNYNPVGIKRETDTEKERERERQRGESILLTNGSSGGAEGAGR